MRRIIHPGQDDARIGAWVGERTGQTDWGLFKAFGVESEGMLVAGVVFNQYRHPGISMHVAGEGGHWLSRSLLRELFDYAFNACGCLRVTGLVRADALNVLKFDKKIGFKFEGRIRRGAADGTDLILLGMLREECRFIDGWTYEETDRLAV